MTSMDKTGIVIAVAIVAAAVGFTATGGSGMPSDIPFAMEEQILLSKKQGRKHLRNYKK